jgi:pentatricopeptide repeat protein
MWIEGVCGDEITILSVLSACGHAGLLDEVRTLFGNMSSKYGIAPKRGHHACMVIAFGCAGYFDEAASVIKAMPSLDLPEIWLVLLRVCAKWGNVELGRLAFHQLVQLDCSFGAAYVLMANAFASAGLQEDAKAMNAMEVKTHARG